MPGQALSPPPPRKRFVLARRILLGVVLAAVALGLLAAWKIGPRNVVGMLRYDHRREGSLRVGEMAPDVELVGLDGGKVRLSSLLGSRPMILVFGSYT